MSSPSSQSLARYRSCVCELNQSVIHSIYPTLHHRRVLQGMHVEMEVEHLSAQTQDKPIKAVLTPAGNRLYMANV